MRPAARLRVNACGVCTVTRSARSTVSTTTPPSTRFTVSASGRTGTAPSTPSAERTEHTLDHRVVDERAGGVVDEHDERVVRHLGECGAHRLGTRRPARDDRGDLGGDELLGEHDRRLPPLRRRDDDDVDPRAVEPLEALREQDPLAEREQMPWADPPRGAHPCRRRREPPRSRRRLSTADACESQRATPADAAAGTVLTRSRLRPWLSAWPSACPPPGWRGPRRARLRPRPRSCSWRT